MTHASSDDDDVPEPAHDFDFACDADAEEWAHRTSLIYDTDGQCQKECERLLLDCIVRGRPYHS